MSNSAIYLVLLTFNVELANPVAVHLRSVQFKGCWFIYNPQNMNTRLIDYTVLRISLIQNNFLFVNLVTIFISKQI